MRNPCVWWHFLDMYSTRQGANKALRKLLVAGIAQVIGLVNFHGEGGDCYVYAARETAKRWKRSQLKHDVIVTTVILALGLEYLRNTDVDADLLADFELYGNGKKINGEVDSGACTYSRIKKERFTKHAQHSEPTLWVSCGLWSTSDMARREGLRERADGLPHMWFTTLGEIENNALNARIINCDDVEKRVSDLLTDPESPSTEKMANPQGKASF
jgi:hypothetical protein